MNYHRKSNFQMILDLGIIGSGIAVAVLMLLIFLAKEKYSVLIPVAFLIGAAANLANTSVSLIRDEEHRRNVPGAIASLILFLVFTAACVVSAATIWFA